MTLKMKDGTIPIKTDTTWLLLIIDRSGSMQRIKEEMQGGINFFFAEQAKLLPEIKTLVSLVQFDDVYEQLAFRVPVQKISEYTLVPRNMTALFDAIGKGVTELGEAYDKVPADKKPTVIVSIITDGLENSSTEWKQDGIKALIEKKTEEGWQFTFLGADQDAITTAKGLGISEGSAMTFTADGAHTSYAVGAYASNVSRRSASGQSVNYTNEDRLGSVAPGDPHATSNS